MKPPGGNYKPNRYIFAPKNAAAAADLKETTEKSPEAANAPNAANAAPANDYKTARVMTASPIGLILMMYEQFLELIPDIKRSIARGSAAAMEPDAERAQAIVEELLNSLDFDVDMSKDLGAIYVYVRNKILEANIMFSADIWDHIETIMRSLYNGFKTAADSLDPAQKQPAIPVMSPSIIAGMTYGQGNIKEVVVNKRAGFQV